AFGARHPGIEIVPEPAPARRALEDVRNGRLDIALVGLPAPATGLNVTPLAVERIVAAVSDRHPLSAARGDPDRRDGRHAARSPAAGDEPAALRLGDRRVPVGSALTAADRHVGALRRTS